jgi:hypothetical protein
LLEDETALTMLESIASHEIAIEERDDKTVLVRCLRRDS